MKEKLRKFMMGRYGADQFSKFLLGAAVVLLVISLFSRKNVFYLLALAVLIYEYFRMFSKNIQKRYQENQKYLGVQNKVLHFFHRKKGRFQQRKEYCFYRCPNCSQEVRVPKGKGQIKIICPKCKKEFEKTT